MKKPIESASQPSIPDVKHSVGETTSATLSNTTSNNVAASHSSLLNEVKSLLSSSNSIVPNLKETSVTVIPTVKSDDTKALNSGADVIKTTTSPTPSFGSNLTITPIGVNDKMTAKPLASVQNQVNYYFHLNKRFLLLILLVSQCIFQKRIIRHVRNIRFLCRISWKGTMTLLFISHNNYVSNTVRRINSIHCYIVIS